MKVVNRDLERLALWFIAKGKPSSWKLLSQVRDEHFSDVSNIAAFKRIKSVVKQKTEIMSWDDLLEDTSVPEKARTLFKAFEKTTNINPKRARELYESLDRYRKLRIAYNGTKQLFEDKLINADSVDVDEFFNDLANLVTKARSSVDDDDFYKFGKDDNTRKITDEILSEEGGMPCFPSGIDIWDRKNRGIPQQSVMLLGADTSGGKSLVADVLIDNFTEFGAKCCLVSLEMDIKPLMVRRISKYTDTDQGKVFNPELISEKERKLAKAALEERRARLAKAGKTIYTKIPKSTPNIEELLTSLQPHGFNCIVIDYISLLRDTGGDDQWRKLSDALAFCKTYQRNTGTLIIVLVQIKKDLQLKFSTAMLDHVDLAWFWVKDEAVVETHIINITCPKARGQEPFNFPVKEEYQYARISNVPKDYKPPVAKDIINPEFQKNNKPAANGNKKKNETSLMNQFFNKKEAA